MCVCVCVYERERGREKAVSNALIPDCSVTRLKLWESVTLSFVMLMSVSVCVCVQEVLAVDTQVKRGSGTAPAAVMADTYKVKVTELTFCWEKPVA